MGPAGPAASKKNGIGIYAVNLVAGKCLEPLADFLLIPEKSVVGDTKPRRVTDLGTR